MEDSAASQRRSYAPLRLACALALAAAATASPGRADEEPVLLTNEDVARLHARTGSRPAADAAEAEAPRAAKTERSDRAEAKAEAEPEDDAISWQEKYYRLKTLALRDALERGETIDFGDGGPTRATTPEPEAPAVALPAASGEPACIYDSDGSLIYGPPGRSCSAERRKPRAVAPASSARACIYGTRGQLLHRPAGRDCESRSH